MSKHSLEDLEKRVARLEDFKKSVERFVRDYSLRNILFNACDSIYLNTAFEGHPVGHYCKKCFADKREFHPLMRIEARFQSSIEESLKNSECAHCKTRTSKSRGMLFYRLLQQAMTVEPVPYKHIALGVKPTKHKG